MTDSVYAFNRLTPEHQRFAGGKGSTLARLIQSGHPVPDGLVIMPVAFAGDEPSPAAWAQVQAHLARLRVPAADAAFAVRSSALAEDSSRASFAGQFETVLDVHTDEEVQSAIRTVRQSRHSERVRAYSQERGLDPDHDMAVVVQRLVRADISGVLFTADPVTGSRNYMTGNYVRGLGEKLVSGEAAHHDFKIWRRKGRYDGPADLRRFARRLFKLARSLEGELGSPQDIEWAIAGKKTYILQSRPITTLLGFDPVTGESNDSLTGDYVWSCVNIGEAMSVVMTPFTWSLIRLAYDELNPLPGYPAAGSIGGRAYQNSTVLVSTFRALRQDVKALIKEAGGVRDEYLENMDQYLERLPEATFFKVLPGAIRMRRKQKASLKNLAEFIARNPGWCRDACRQIQAVQTKEELALLVEYVLPRARQSFWRTVATVWRYSELTGKLRRDLVGLVGAADADVLLSNVSNHGELLASLGPLVGLDKVMRGQISREEYLQEWGHRGPLEVEMSSPRPFEDPGWLDRQLATFARSPVDVQGLLDRQRAAFDAAWQRFQSRYPRKAKSVRRRLDRVAGAARVRESVRSEATRLMWVARTWARRVGQLTGIDEGIFFLTLDEVRDLLAERDSATQYMPARQQTYERYRALPPYPMVIRGRFDPFRWAADPNRRSDVFDSHGLLTETAERATHDNVILGMPGSSGRFEGMVRRLDNPDAGDELRPGEVLVTSQTNIGWTFLFPRAGAIVTDVGAPLSHAAIVARELGIPAVVNCGDATMRLRTGDRVRVDGVQGTVEILDSESAV